MGKLSMNGTEISTTKENGQTMVSITTEDADIYVNGVKIWSKYDKPEYQQIPPVLRSFIFGRNDYLKTEEGNTVADCWMKDKYTCATFYMPQNMRSKIIVRLDLITSLEDLETEYIRNTDILTDEEADTLVREFKDLFNSIEEKVTSAGYKLSFSHATGHFMYGWWDVAFDLAKWNEEAFLSIWNSFEEFNKKVSTFMDIYNS